ncbi:MAG TPA: 50S ribosomal protein L24 [Candidatus Protoclostridium stercorigallinarum]|uniref:Large ribosomal subunit protein uL24 n=1 Tax=Candidatus Protoclostridium stercorigallinarum TaxID=2838741 RepID=A0A9D1Q0U5_9FIRM|nr:50S ribosomal protein L24 [Candidatus Protoclostridium stercorigallinarum]
MNGLNVKKGDNVLVLAGQDKGKKGTVISASPKAQTVRVEGVNVVTKHVKPRGAQNPGGIMKEPGNIHVSNVQVICPDCGKPTRVAHAIVDGKKARVCKHCGASLDKQAKAAVKKEKKAAKKAKKETEAPAEAAAETTTDAPAKKKATRKTKKAEE